MSTEQNSHLPVRLRTWAQLISFGVMLAGALVLAGWILDIAVLKSVIPGWGTMKANTALAFVLAGVSLLLLRTEPAPKPRTRTKGTPSKLEIAKRVVGQACSVVVSLIGLLTLSEYLFGLDLGIDQLLVRDPTRIGLESIPGRMGFPTALNFLLLGAALLLLDIELSPGRYPAQILILIAWFISIGLVTGYAYAAPSVHQVGTYASVALHTAILLLVVSTGLLCARPERGVMAIVSCDSISGRIMRRLLLASICALFGLGWLRIAGQWAGLYSTEVGTFLLVISAMVTLSALIWFNVRSLHQTDLQRRQGEEALRQSEARKTAILDSAQDGIISIDHEGVILEFNSGAQRIFGYTRDQVMGKEMAELIIPPSLREGHRRGLAHFLASGQGPVLGRRIELTALRADGTEFPVELSITQIGTVQPPTFTGFVRDITERKRAQTELERQRTELQLILDAVPAMVFYKDRQHRHVRVNQALVRLHGVTKDAIEGLTDKDMGSPHTERYYRDDDEVMSTGRAKRGIIEPLETARGTRWLETDKLPYCDNAGRIIGVIGFALDITERKKAAEALQESEGLLRAVFETAVDGILTIDEQGLIRTINPAAERIFGYASIEVVGRNIKMLMPEPYQSEHDSYLANYQRTGERKIIGIGREVTGRRKDGSVFPLDLAVSETRLGERRIFTGIVRDITERKRAQEANERLAAVVESSDDAIISKTLDGLITSWNTGAEKMFGYSSQEAIGKSMMMLFPPDHTDEELAILARLARGEHIEHFETVRVSKDGKPIQVSATISPIKDSAGRIIGASKIARDISQRKKAEEEIRRLNAELEQRVVERTTQLESANKELEAFSYSVSHDLRSPLRGIAGYAQILGEEYKHKLDDEGKRILGVIQNETQRMGRLIDELLSFSRLGRQQLKSSPLDMTSLAQAVFRELTALPGVRKPNLDLKPLPPAQGDPPMMRQVLVNLLSNAIKFSRHRPVAAIEIGAQDDAQQITYYVKDNGVGFDPKYSNKLFGVFQRLHHDDEFEGTGVGLALVHRIIHRHGGRIWAESKPDAGATFYFTLPK